MNIEILAPYCTTAKQQKLLEKLLEKLRKKLSLKSSKDLQTVYELVGCLFVSKQYEGLLAFLPEVLAVPFAENFDLWYPIEHSFALIAEVPTITPEQRKACFSHFKTVRDFKSTKGAQEAFDYYFHRYLALYFVHENLEDLEDLRDLEDLEDLRDLEDLGEIDEYDTSYQLWIHIAIIASASAVKLINEEVDYKTLDFPNWILEPTYNSREELQNYMNTLIAEQLTALQDKKFVKYY